MPEGQTGSYKLDPSQTTALWVSVCESKFSLERTLITFKQQTLNHHLVKEYLTQVPFCLFQSRLPSH